MTIELPVRSDFPSYTFQIDLEEVSFIFKFRFNERMQRWIMDINDADENPILSGVPVLTAIPLTDEYVVDGLPPGRFIAINQTGTNANPLRDDLGNDVKLLYEESA